MEARIHDGRQPIALCEAAMVPLALTTWPERFRGRSVVWFVDNTAAMSAFVKGVSGNPHLEKIVGLTWIIAFHLSTTIWFEWVELYRWNKPNKIVKSSIWFRWQPP